MVPLWDAAALCLWLASFVVRGFRWRGGQYEIRDGLLIPVFEQEPAIEPVVMQEVPSSSD